MSENLLVELFTEELPPKVLRKLGEAFANSIADGLRARGLIGDTATVTPYATPRRLAVTITEVHADGRDETYAEKLMPVAVGLDGAGNATPALTKKLAAKGLAHIDIKTLARESDGKTDQLVYRGVKRGLPLVAALQVALDEAITALPVPKLMSYQLADGATTVQFVRPAHGLVALHGTALVPIGALGLYAGRVTHGHRFQGAKNIELAHADDYEVALQKQGHVIASFTKRRYEIERLLRQREEECGDTLGDKIGYDALLDEVTALVEQPSVYVGQFESEFLSVPAECLTLTMKQNQKYFPLYLSEGGLSARFLIVSNMRLDDPREVIEGNQRVVRPRLADARFFFETDQKTKLADRVPRLADVVYHNRLGSQLGRLQRVQQLAGQIATLIGADRVQAERAAYLAKADLLTDMVGEFPELQGTMGRYYALHDGEVKDVADAIEQHYWPKNAGGELPAGRVAIALMLADKLEALAGLFSIGQQPTGDKDPFALRRHALGIVRGLIEKRLSLDLPQLLAAASALFNKVVGVDDAPAALETFVYERLRGYLRDQNYSALEVESVLALRPSHLDQLPAQLHAVHAFMALPEAASLAAANKRIANILKKADGEFAHADIALCKEPAERVLFEAVRKVTPPFDAHYDAARYTEALQTLAPLKTPVDAFFDNVMVNAEDAKLRVNRLALLADLHRLMNRIADLSKLAV